MDVLINQSQCQGHAQCAAQAPEVFTLDDDGYIGVDGTLAVPAGQEEAARRGAAACPERVITISGG